MTSIVTPTGVIQNATQISHIPRIAEIFAENRNSPWIFAKPGGNWGDRLIHVGAEKIASAAGVSWRYVDVLASEADEIPRGAFVYLHGGGGLNTWGSELLLKMLLRAISIPGVHVVQGPQTCEVESPIYGAHFERILDHARCASLSVYARETVSWGYMRAHFPGDVQIGLDHDTAMSLDLGDILDLIGASRLPKPRYDLVVSRLDDEMPQSPVGSGSPALVIDPALHATTFAHWARIHLYARSITTNRLHSAILGSIAGIPVTLLPGSYHKNRSVWEFSLRERGVLWADTPPVSDGRHFEATKLLPRFLRRSWKIQRLALWLKGLPMK